MKFVIDVKGRKFKFSVGDRYTKNLNAFPPYRWCRVRQFSHPLKRKFLDEKGKTTLPVFLLLVFIGSRVAMVKAIAVRRHETQWVGGRQQSD